MEVEINSGCHQVYPRCISTLPQVVEPEGTSKALGSVRDWLSPAREGKLQWKLCLHPHLEQGGAPPMEGSKGAGRRFFLSYRWELLKVPDSHPWIVSWKMDKFDPQSLKKTCLTFFCKSAWPQYPLESSRQWPVEGSLSYDTVLQLDQFCRRQRKWVEVPYGLLFFSLRDMPDLCPKVLRSVLMVQIWV